MINEIERAEELLSGKPFKKEYFFSAYCVLIKYFLGEGLSPQNIRLKILEWEEKYGHKRYFDLNDVIIKFCDDKIVANGLFKVNISEQDIIEINSRFDKPNERKIAFAMLCYAKINADKNGCFYLSYAELDDWLNIGRTNIRQRYLPTLLKMNYIERVKGKKSTFTWDKEKNKNYYQKNKFKINVDYSNNFDGKWLLENNDIIKLYNEIFSK